MNSDSLARIREISLAAARLPENEREAYLDDACDGDDALRREVKSLLAYEARTPDVLETGALESRFDSAMATQDRPSIPARLGPFMTLDVLGEGGMGIVYRAEQTEPIRREVALKLIRTGTDSAAVLARFESERQTLAQMDHPNIARVLDAGSDEAGRPWFAMELVRGGPITAYCRSRRLDVAARIRLFLDVCGAVRHAHRRGIIHRDLKPSNILVCEVHGEPVPKIIDFSIAKALDDPALVTEHRTRTGQVVGTLEYMSPEQARGANGEIDTRSDVYALGVVLYELLTERLPLTLADLPLHDAVRRIQEDPPDPVRKTAPGSIGVDVATIVGKCLEKEPDRRYGSAGELVEELERYLASRPILARPPSATYQLRKLVGRHRVAFGVASVLFLFLVVFAAVVSIQLGVQRAERARAEAAATRAQEEQRKSERVVAFITTLLGTAEGGASDPEVTIVDALEFVRPAIEQDLAGEPQVAAAVLSATGVIYRTRRMHELAEDALQEALQLRVEHLGESHPDVGSSYLDLANLRHHQERLDEADDFARRALDIFEMQDEPDLSAVALVLNTLGLNYIRLGRFEEAASALRRSVGYFRDLERPTREQRESTATVSGSLAGILRRQGRYIEAEALMREVVEELYALRPGSSGVATAMYNHATVLMLLGRNREAEELLRDCLEIEVKHVGDDDPWPAVTIMQLGRATLGLGRHAEAERCARTAIGLHRTAPPFFRRYLVQDLTLLAEVLAEQGKPEEAEAAGREAVATAEEALGTDHPRVAPALVALSRALEVAGRWAEAEETLRQAERIIRESVGDDNPQVASVLGARARCLRNQGDVEQALQLARQALEGTQRALGDDHPEVAVTAQEVAEALALLGDTSEAARHASIALAVWNNSEYTDPDDIRRAEALAGTR